MGIAIYVRKFDASFHNAWIRNCELGPEIIADRETLLPMYSHPLPWALNGQQRADSYRGNGVLR